MAPVQCFSHGLVQSCPHFRPLTVSNGIQQKLTKRPPIKNDFAQNIKNLATKCFPRLLQFFEKSKVNLAFASFLSDKVPEVAHLCLSNSVDAAKTLLEAIRVPWQVVVNHEMRAL